MPKEKLNETRGDFSIVVGWTKENDDLGLAQQPVQIGVECEQEFTFEDGDVPYDSLWFSFESLEEVNKFVKLLHKAKRQAFK